MHFQRLSVLSALVASALALSAPSNYVSHEKRSQGLKQWVKREEVSRQAVLPMRIGLRQPNVENGRGDELLLEV